METPEPGDQCEAAFAWEEAEDGAPLACVRTEAGAWGVPALAHVLVVKLLWRHICVPRVLPSLLWVGMVHAWSHANMLSTHLQVSFRHLDPYLI